MLPKFPSFKRLELSDKADIEKITNQFPPYSDFNFTSLWCWYTHDQILISELHNNLVVKFTDYQSLEPFYSFIGINDVDNTVVNLLNLAKKEEISMQIKLLPEETIKFIDKTKFQIEEDIDNFDYNLYPDKHFDILWVCLSCKISECLDTEDIDYVVLAKYMRILTPRFVEEYNNKIINIHHSFLPAFIGANPYKQAYDRGVKIIGATAHFVNNNLDEGPIIAQDLRHIDHAFDWKDMQRLGKDVEKIVLSRALKLALEDRIFVYANKTVIF